jgi:hypothetical protein
VLCGVLYCIDNAVLDSCVVSNDPTALHCPPPHRYLCLFSTALPPESAARVWDSLLLEGRKVLHRVGLAVLTGVGPQLMRHDNPGGCDYLYLYMTMVVCVWGGGGMKRT